MTAQTGLVSTHDYETIQQQLTDERAARRAAEEAQDEANRRAAQAEIILEWHRLIIETIHGCTAPNIKPAETKALIVFALEAFKAQKPDGWIPLDHLATCKTLAARLGMSENTVRDCLSKLQQVGLVQKKVERHAVNRNGEDIESRHFKPEHGDHFESRCTMAITAPNPEEWERKAKMTEGLRSKNQTGAKDRAKAERVLAKMVKTLAETPCPVCGVIGELHISCKCGWKDVDLPEKPTTPKQKRERTSNFADGRKIKIDYRAPDYVPPCPGDLDQMPDERMTLHYALKNLSGRRTPPSPRMDYANFEEPAFNVSVPTPQSLEVSYPRASNFEDAQNHNGGVQ